MSDYVTHMLFADRTKNLFNATTGWDGPEFFENKVFMVEGVYNGVLGAIRTNFDGHKQVELFTTPLDDPDTEKRQAAEDFVIEMLGRSYIYKVYHNSAGGLPALGDLVKKEGNSELQCYASGLRELSPLCIITPGDLGTAFGTVPLPSVAEEFEEKGLAQLTKVYRQPPKKQCRSTIAGKHTPSTEPSSTSHYFQNNSRALPINKRSKGNPPQFRPQNPLLYKGWAGSAGPEGIRWSSPTQLLLWPYAVYLGESGRDPELSTWYGHAVSRAEADQAHITFLPLPRSASFSPPKSFGWRKSASSDRV
ncbi:hypothetical protein DL766_007468 [Monosporascus sp. MC13-8B]|uniref:Uncharacterized protein n=1 Tax=Monosporascus cannonballus TaxID=155416 RepID=A0ABY0GTA7_9PEZI|nr:hypothetical protein DL762_009582 [Monosporascus cannonballus]RYO82041.1 hypothetical protein DL763_008373 [Monosporascus cannonballus]RYP23759.1 hypothetical protein DL766_007468 [Monosporascus sp. MC13-8B]